MEMGDYQRQALESDRTAGEAGTLLSEYKKHLRDGPAHHLHRERVAEELGDLLWYLSNVASKYDLDLNDVAAGNLAKARARWVLRGRAGTELGPPQQFDIDYPEPERFPRQLVVDIEEAREGDAVRVRMFVDGTQLGDPVRDNTHGEDGYRFHDVFHLTHAAVLGWSPVIRALLRRKRKSSPEVDDAEDGGRAIAIEEGLTAIIFNYAQNHGFLEGVTALDEALLRTIKGVTSQLEVSRCSEGEWETAVLQGFDVWREITARGGGRLLLDLDARSIALA